MFHLIIGSNTYSWLVGSLYQGVTNCCQISYTLPEIPFEISEITEIQNLKSRKVETVISKFLYISASNHVKIGRTISNKLLVKVTNHETS